MKKAFSLMELMIVIIILGLLAALVLPQITGKAEQARQKLVCVQMKTISEALKTFKLELHSYPSMDEGILALIQNPDTDKYKGYPSGGYLDSKKVPKDPWGGEYIYLLEDSDFDLVSLGADHKEGGDDENKDIKFSTCND